VPACRQYPTSPHIAAQVLSLIQGNYGDIEGRAVGDLGCGCGMLTIAAALLGSRLRAPPSQYLPWPLRC
jgi:predicted RNA methylase